MTRRNTQQRSSGQPAQIFGDDVLVCHKILGKFHVFQAYIELLVLDINLIQFTEYVAL
jgi:hypothetical protein